MITKTYKINNDCIGQLQHCCDEHYQICEDFTKEENQEYVKIFDWLENLKSTNEIVIYYVDKLPENADTKKDIYVLANSKQGNRDKTEHNIFNDVLDYFGQYEECWNKKLQGDQLKHYGWSSKKSLLDSFKLWEILELGRPINKSSGYVSDIDNWVDAGSLKDCIYHSMTIRG